MAELHALANPKASISRFSILISRKMDNSPRLRALGAHINYLLSWLQNYRLTI
jgi:hypothetical protein